MTCSRNERRRRRGDVLLFGWSAAESGWRVTKSITRERFDQLQRRGHRFEPIHEWGTERVIGYQSTNVVSSDHDLPSAETRAAITPAEMDLIAGQAFAGGRSRTMGLPEELRINRVHPLSGHALPPEDAIERAVGKLDVFQGTRLR
jgi:hypothetical protein